MVNDINKSTDKFILKNETPSMVVASKLNIAKSVNESAKIDANLLNKNPISSTINLAEHKSNEESSTAELNSFLDKNIFELYKNKD